MTNLKILNSISDFLVPIQEMKNYITDCTYFLHKNGSFIFAEGYNQPDDIIIGNVIYYPNNKGHNNYYGHIYASMNKQMINGELERISHDDQYKKHLTLDMDLIPHENLPVYAKYRMGFPKKDIIGFFEHKKALTKCYSTNKSIQTAIDDVKKFLNIPQDRLGVTGSLSFGIFSEVHDDIDIVWYGSVEENRLIEKRIRALVKNDTNKVFEFGRFWPIRFFYNKIMFCSFFCYSNPKDSPLYDFSVKILEDKISGYGTVSDDTHGIYMPLFLEMKNVKTNTDSYDKINLIIYNGFLRGEYQNNNKLKFNGKLVELTRKNRSGKTIVEKTILVTFYKDIDIAK